MTLRWCDIRETESGYRVYFDKEEASVIKQIRDPSFVLPVPTYCSGNLMLRDRFREFSSLQDARRFCSRVTQYSIGFIMTFEGLNGKLFKSETIWMEKT
tara:strand:+ start:117 stop:413 length:297 start_codon:yes stop_codon:yes gene_type:complete